MSMTTTIKCAYSNWRNLFLNLPDSYIQHQIINMVMIMTIMLIEYWWVLWVMMYDDHDNNIILYLGALLIVHLLVFFPSFFIEIFLKSLFKKTTK